MARRKGGGIGPGAMRMGGPGRKPSAPPTPMASAPSGPPGGLGGPGPAGPTPGPLGVKKGGAVKHARGGMVEGSPREEKHESMSERKREGEKYFRGGPVAFEKGGDVKARVRAGRDHC